MGFAVCQEKKNLIRRRSDAPDTYEAASSCILRMTSGERPVHFATISGGAPFCRKLRAMRRDCSCAPFSMPSFTPSSRPLSRAYGAKIDPRPTPYTKKEADSLLSQPHKHFVVCLMERCRNQFSCTVQPAGIPSFPVGQVTPAALVKVPVAATPSVHDWKPFQGPVT